MGEKLKGWLFGKPADGQTDQSRVHSFRSIDVLVAEDDPNSREYICRVLEEFALRFACVTNGQDAIEAYLWRTPRVVLMDVTMPRCDGVLATQCIRDYERNRGLPNVPVIAVSSTATPGLREKYMKEGMTDYLQKPFRPHQLIDKLENWLGWSMEPAAMVETGKMPKALVQYSPTARTA